MTRDEKKRMTIETIASQFYSALRQPIEQKSIGAPKPTTKQSPFVNILVGQTVISEDATSGVSYNQGDRNITWWETAFLFELTHSETKSDSHNTYIQLAEERKNLRDDLRAANLAAINLDVLNWWLESEGAWENVSDDATLYVQRIDFVAIVQWKEEWNANGVIPPPDAGGENG